MNYYSDNEETDRPADQKSTPERQPNPYIETVKVWRPLGFAVIPARRADLATSETDRKKGKAPYVTWKEFSAGRGRTPARVPKGKLRQWLKRWGNADRGLLILDSHPDPAKRLVVIDIDMDDPRLFEWVVSEFGRPELVVTSGRGWHLYYRAPAGVYIKSSAKKIGPEWSLDERGETAIDVKAGGSYVAAPGSWHRERGRCYTASAAVTAELLARLPIFDADKYEAMVAARRRPRGGGGGGGAKGSVHIARHEFTRSNIGVVTEAGESGTLGGVGAALGTGDYIQVFCPYHDNKNTPAASVRRGSGGLTLTCFGSCCTTWKVVDPVVLDPDEYGPRDDDLNALVDEMDTPWSRAKLTFYKKDEMVGGRYIPNDPLMAKVTLLRAGLGTGKTHFAAALSKEATASEKEVFVIAPRRSLIDDIVHRFDGVVQDYREITGPIRESAATCLDSSHRISLARIANKQVKNTRPGLVVIDEVRTIRHALLTGCMDGFEASRAYASLKYILRQAEHVLVADALAGPEDLGFIRELAGVEPDECEVRLTPTGSDYVYKVTHDEFGVRAQVRAWVKEGKRLAIPMMASAAAQALAREVQSWAPTMTVEVITADTLEALKKKGRSIKNVNAWATDVDVLIYSPALGTGVSIDVRDHFDHVVGFAWQRVGTAHDLAQMVHRVRHPKNKEIVLWLRRYSVRPEFGIKQIEAEWKEQIRQTLTEGRAWGMEVGQVQVTDQGVPVEQGLWRAGVQTESDRRRWGAQGGLMDAWVELCGQEGWTVGDWTTDHLDLDDADDLRESKKEARKVIEQERADDIVAANQMPIEEARSLREPEDRDQALAVERAELCEFYGTEPDQLTTADVLHDKGGRRRQQARLYTDVEAMHLGMEKQLLLRDVKSLEKGGHARLARRGGRARRAWAISEILGWFGIELADILGDPHDPSFYEEEVDRVDRLDTSKWAEAATNALKFRRALAALDLTPHVNVQDKPGAYLSSVLRKLGIKLIRERKTTRKDGTVNRYWQYRFDPESIASIYADSRASAARLAEAVVAEEAETAQVIRLMEELDQGWEELERLVDVMLG